MAAKVKGIVANWYSNKAVDLDQGRGWDYSATQIENLRRFAWDLVSGEPAAINRIGKLADYADLDVFGHKVCHTKTGDPFVRMECENGRQINFFPNGRHGAFLSEWTR